MKINLPDSVNAIINRLEQNGYEAWAVGGCVRDSLLGRTPKDWDITTSALPEEIKSIFSRTIDTGIEHGTVTVMYEGIGYETTTYRIDGKYSDSRHPDSVEFSRSLDEDLKRRDFTINAMAYSENCGIVDLFGGVGDLNNRIIRCVGDPVERFSEDALRILRAIRFSAELNFDIDDKTLEAASKLKERLRMISAERIHVELEKLIMSSNPEKIEFLHSSGVDEVIMPDLPKSVKEDPLTIKKLSDMLAAAPRDKRVRWAVLVHMIRSGIDILRELKFDNDTIHAVSELLRLENVRLTGISDAEMRRVMHNAGSENMPLLFDYRHTIDPETDYSGAVRQYEAICSRGECTSLKDLAVSGTDLMESGVPAGKEVGRILNVLLEEVMEDPASNKREVLIDKIKELKK
ncbi:MAG: CCA tRNA nucleotidyltransferase [Lachnospiraceae bacterium]|nr:CCA tRNA nucleotidyltransferase [Lachnospiraceae bacterium]